MWQKEKMLLQTAFLMVYSFLWSQKIQFQMFEIFTNLFYITTYSNNTLQPADVENRKLKAKKYSQYSKSIELVQ